VRRGLCSIIPDRRPITGLLIAKGDTILFERYQYGRTDAHRLISFSMANTIVGLLVGIAIEEGAMRKAGLFRGSPEAMVLAQFISAPLLRSCYRVTFMCDRRWW
jgi:hypothetical protein